MSHSTLHTVLIGAVLLWCLAIILPPLCLEMGPSFTPIAAGIYRMYSPICHQFDSHSIHIGGYKLAVCSRCMGIYFGFLLGWVVTRFFFRKTRLSGLRGWI